MQRKTNNVAANAVQMGLEANIPRTKHMLMNSRSLKAIQIQLFGTANEEVDEIRNLGSKMTSDGSCDVEIQSRLCGQWVWPASSLPFGCPQT